MNTTDEIVLEEELLNVSVLNSICALVTIQQQQILKSNAEQSRPLKYWRNYSYSVHLQTERNLVLL